MGQDSCPSPLLVRDILGPGATLAEENLGHGDQTANEHGPLEPRHEGGSSLLRVHRQDPLRQRWDHAINLVTAAEHAEPAITSASDSDEDEPAGAVGPDSNANGAKSHTLGSDPKDLDEHLSLVAIDPDELAGRNENYEEEERQYDAKCAKVMEEILSASREVLLATELVDQVKFDTTRELLGYAQDRCYLSPDVFRGECAY